VITAVAGKPVDSREAFSTYTALIPTAQPLAMTVARNGTSRNATVTPVDPPGGLGLRILEDVAGLRVADEHRSVVIDQVLGGTRAAEIGLAAGDVIVSVNGNEITSTTQLNTELMRGAERSSIVLSVARGRYVYNLTFPMGV
jgi:S1-C subfamily serine protease